MPEYTILARITFRTTVVVEADSETEALEQFADGMWEFEEPDSGEAVDWEPLGRPQEVVI